MICVCNNIAHCTSAVPLLSHQSLLVGPLFGLPVLSIVYGADLMTLAVAISVSRILINDVGQLNRLVIIAVNVRWRSFSRHSSMDVLQDMRLDVRL